MQTALVIADLADDPHDQGDRALPPGDLLFVGRHLLLKVINDGKPTQESEGQRPLSATP